MFGFFRKKEQVPFVRYKILPYKESGFIVERHTGKSKIENLLDVFIMGQSERMFTSKDYSFFFVEYSDFQNQRRRTSVY